MTESLRPDVGQVLGRLKDFQRATAQYAFDRLYGHLDFAGGTVHLGDLPNQNSRGDSIEI